MGLSQCHSATRLFIYCFNCQRLGRANRVGGVTMKYFKDSNNVIYAYDADGSQDEYIKDGLIHISEDEAMSIVNPPPTKEDLIREAALKKTSLLAEIDTVTKLWQTQLALNIILDSDKEKLKEWMRYAQSVAAVDPDSLPESWPVKPSV
ncbi:tail fiber assembly protein [Edwardsiella tarda]|nr:tail fiber assembly protein [Edwardsiella tarda]